MKLKIFLFSIFLFFVLAVSGLILINKEIQIMHTQYPYFDLKTQSYQWSDKKPTGWKSLKQISKNLKWAIIISEDWAYYDHAGVDYRQLKIVLRDAFEEGEISRGASTITQQFVKNAFLSADRSITRKVLEILYSLMIEREFNKNYILERYLNIIEMGKDIYGVGRASLYYFGKEVDDLNLKESCFLAVLLPSPIRYAQSYRDNELTEFMETQISELFIKLRQAKIINDMDILVNELTPIYFNH